MSSSREITSDLDNFQVDCCFLLFYERRCWGLSLCMVQMPPAKAQDSLSVVHMAFLDLNSQLAALREQLIIFF